MNNTNTHHFFTGLLLAVFVLALYIFLPFLTPIILAITLTIIFGPVYRFFARKLSKDPEKSTISAIITLGLVGLIVIIPAIFIVGRLYKEIQDMYYFLTDESGRSSIILIMNDISTRISSMLFDLYPAFSFDSLNITEYLKSMLEWGFSHVDTLFAGVSRIVLGAFVMFLALFYFLRDGRQFKKDIIAVSPLIDSDDETILKKLEQAIYSIVAGSLIVGVIQGILTGIGFAIFGVPNPVVWGIVAAVAALIPGIGTSLVIVPGVLYLFFTDSTPYAIGLLIWGMLAVGLIDNILGPILVNRGIKIHPLIILLSVLGGFVVFGVVGFILGPLVLAFLFALLEIYKTSKVQI